MLNMNLNPFFILLCINTAAAVVSMVLLAWIAARGK